MQDIEKVGNRLKEIIKDKKLSIRQFEMNVGASNGQISRIIKNNTDLTVSLVQKIIFTYEDINLYYLLLNKGPMFLSNQDYTNEIGKFVNNDNVKELSMTPEEKKRLKTTEEQIATLTQQVKDLTTILKNVTQNKAS